MRSSHARSRSPGTRMSPASRNTTEGRRTIDTTRGSEVLGGRVCVARSVDRAQYQPHHAHGSSPDPPEQSCLHGQLGSVRSRIPPVRPGRAPGTGTRPTAFPRTALPTHRHGFILSLPADRPYTPSPARPSAFCGPGPGEGDVVVAASACDRGSCGGPGARAAGGDVSSTWCRTTVRRTPVSRGQLCRPRRAFPADSGRVMPRLNAEPGRGVTAGTWPAESVGDPRAHAR
jgi:hypothetical protein